MWEDFALLGVHEASAVWLVEMPQPALLWTPLHFLQGPPQSQLGSRLLFLYDESLVVLVHQNSFFLMGEGIYSY